MKTVTEGVPLFYVAAPVGTGPRRRLNLESVRLWFSALIVSVPCVAFAIPWLPYVELLDEDTHRDRGIRDDLTALRRCDGVVACPGPFDRAVMSPGMITEWDLAASIRLRQVSLMDLQFPAYAATQREIAKRFELACA